MISPTPIDLPLYSASRSGFVLSFDSSVCLRVSPLISLPIKTIVVSLRLKLSLTPLGFNRLRGEATTYCFSLSFNSESFLASQLKLFITSMKCDVIHIRLTHLKAH